MEYISTSQNPFDSWRIMLVTTVLGTIILFLLHVPYSLLISFIVSIIIILVLTISQTTTVSRYSNNLHCTAMKGSKSVADMERIETWWNYDFGSSSRDYTNLNSTERRQTTNKVNLYVEIHGTDGSVVIYEKIHMGSKFPNAHDYDPNRTPNKKEAFKVWDVDRCISKLKLNEVS